MEQVLKPEETGLLVVDMQNAFCHGKGSFSESMKLDISALQSAIPGCKSLISLARKYNIPVTFTRYIYKPDYSDGGILARDLMPGIIEARSLIKGTWDIEILDELNPQTSDNIVDKNRPSCYYNTALASWLEREEAKGSTVAAERGEADRDPPHGDA